MDVGHILEELLEVLSKTKNRQSFIEANKILELLIGHYFSGNNYSNNGEEWSREDSKIMAYTLLNTLQFNEMILDRDN